MKNVDYALAYAEQGFFVFPCKADKTPACANGVNDATTDPERIRALWSDNPDFNIGVCPGKSGHCVVDVDPPAGEETLERVLVEEGVDKSVFENTYITRTPRGGTHYWFEGATRSTVGDQGIGSNIDTRSNGGYVLVPPSYVDDPKKDVHGAYEQVNENDIAPLPEFVARRTARKAEPAPSKGESDDQPHNVALAVAYIKTLHPVMGAGSDAVVYKAMCMCRDWGVSGQKALELFETHLDMERDENFDDWLLDKRNNAYKYAENEPGSKAQPDPAKVFGDQVEALPIDMSKQNKDGKPRFHLYKVSDCQSWPDPTWMIPDLLPAVATGMVFGPPKSFKSLLTLDMCLGLATGTRTFGHTPERKHKIIYIAGEGPVSISKKHIPAWCNSRGIAVKDLDDTFALITRIIEVAEPGALIELMKEIEDAEFNPDLIIIDTQARATLGLEENSPKDMGIFVKALDEMKRRLECTICAIHHSGKEIERGSRGTNAVEGGVDFVLQVERHKKTLAVALKVKEMRDALEREEPYYFLGDIIAPSVAFNEISHEEFAEIVKTESRVSQKIVVDALRALGAVSEADGVPTDVLAVQIDPTCADKIALKKELVRELKAAGAPKGKLEAFTKGRGQSLVWFIPGLGDHT